MKLLRFGPKGREQPGILDASGTIRSLEGIVDDIAGAVLSDESIARLSSLDHTTLPEVAPDTRIGPCVGHVGKFICIGLNYADHAAESGMSLPEEPVVFFKATSAITGPDDPVEIPRTSVRTDWEVELGVVIGRPAKYVGEAEALDHVAGYCVINDLSERDFQLRRSGQWVKGKSADTFGPIGPWLVTRDEIADPQNLAMFLEVNGHRYQDGSTRTMHFGVATLISHLSQFMSLQPGDVISTGTPPGVGMGQTPETYLKPGDRMRLGIEGLGVQTQSVIASPHESSAGSGPDLDQPGGQDWAPIQGQSWVPIDKGSSRGPIRRDRVKSSTSRRSALPLTELPPIIEAVMVRRVNEEMVANGGPGLSP